jgi:hypothetical protein
MTSNSAPKKETLLPWGATSHPWSFNPRTIGVVAPNTGANRKSPNHPANFNNRVKQYAKLSRTQLVTLGLILFCVGVAFTITALLLA